MNLCKLLPILFACFLFTACSQAPIQAPAQAVVTAQTQLETDVPTSAPTNTRAPTITPLPTREPLPTRTPAPTNTPHPTSTPTQVPEPIVLTGSGDSVIDLGIEIIGGAAVAHIVGNAASSHFAVTSYDSTGEYVDLLVNTTDPYDGFVPVNFLNEGATRVEVKAVGDWTITLLPLAIEYSHLLDVPGVYNGTGDDVVFLSGADPDTARITGNAGSNHFAVIAYGNDWDLLVNTTDPYNGTVIVSGSTFCLVVTAVGEWTIELIGR